jgi:predicted HicB family RNase H-like nuclease
MPRKQKPKVGRPKMKEGEARDTVLQSRVQESEKETYQRAAKAAGKDLSTWVRETLNAALK